MTKQVPDAGVTPRSAKEVAGVVRCASREGIRLAIRGGGHSQGGQSLTDCGVVLDTRRLDRVQRVSSGLVRAQGGARWSQVLDALRGTRRLPRVLADTGDVTVGGTLSAGGVGSTSHRHGAQAGQVERLEVVTGTGERVLCSPSRNEGLFNAVRGGQGQFGIITEAWIRLRAAGKRFRQHQLLYRDNDRFADDFEYVVEADRFDHLRAEIRCHEREILLCAGFEHAGEPDDEAVLAGLQYDENTYTRDTASVGRAVMYPSWAFSWLHYHPWRDWILPWDALRTLLARPLPDSQWVPPRPWSWTGLYALGSEAIDAPMFMRPRGSRAICYSVLVVHGEFQYEKATGFAGRLREVDRTLVGLGGKSYLSGGVDYGPEEWAEHYGEMLDQAIAWKREFDPKQVFNPAGMPFADSATASGLKGQRQRAP